MSNLLKLTLASLLILTQCHLIKKKMNTESKLIGSRLKTQIAVSKADIIVIAEIIDLGLMGSDAPGEAYFENAKIKVHEILKGILSDNQMSISFVVQLFPKNIAEEIPKEGKKLVMFIEKNINSEFQAIKMILYSQEEIKLIKSQLDQNDE